MSVGECGLNSPTCCPTTISCYCLLFQMPVYVIMPVNSTLYNDALQQLLFLYTVDFKPWQIAEGRIVHIPIDGVVSIATGTRVIFCSSKIRSEVAINFVR